jgi:transposase-like protein
VWPEGPVCPHCGGVERISKMQGKSTRKGLYKCYQCRKPFTVRMGTIFESSKVPLHVWLQAMYLLPVQRRASARTSWRAPLASPSRLLGSCRTAFVRRCARAI